MAWQRVLVPKAQISISDQLPRLVAGRSSSHQAVSMAEWNWSRMNCSQSISRISEQLPTEIRPLVQDMQADVNQQQSSRVPKRLSVVVCWHVQVTKEEGMQWLENLYGGDGNTLHSADNASKPANVPNAYKLVYVRQSEWDNIMKDIPLDTIPAAVRQRQEVSHSDLFLLRLVECTCANSVPLSQQITQLLQMLTS